MNAAVVLCAVVVLARTAAAQVNVDVRMEQGANDVLNPVTPAPSSTFEVWDCISVGLPFGVGSVSLDYNVQDFGVGLRLDWTDTPTEVLTTGCGFFPVCPVPPIDTCGPQITERIDYGRIRGGMSVYCAAAGGGFTGGASYTRIAEGTFDWHENLEVFAPSAMNIRLPLTVSGSVSGAESFGDPNGTYGKAELSLTGSALGTPVNSTVSVESTSVIPETANISEVTEVYAFVPAGSTLFTVSLSGKARVEARAQSAGLFGTITGAATAIADFPNSLRIGRITLDDGSPLPSGVVVRGVNSNIYYEGVAAGVPTPSPYCFCAPPAGAPCGNSFAEGGCANSTGAGVTLYSTGPASVALDTLVLRTTPIPSTGLIFMGRNTLLTAFGDGLRCVGGSTYRFPLQNGGSQGLSTGPGVVAYSAAQFAGVNGAIAAGDTWHFQAWYRDGSGPCGSGSNLTNGLSVTFYP
jgi:hypothetical protein